MTMYSGVDDSTHFLLWFLPLRLLQSNWGIKIIGSENYYNEYKYLNSKTIISKILFLAQSSNSGVSFFPSQTNHHHI